MKKIAIFDQYLVLSRVVNVRPSDVVNRVPPDHGKLMTPIVRVCVQHSSEAHKKLPYYYGHFVATGCDR